MIAKDEIILIAPPSHNWAKKRSIHTDDLVKECMISREEESGTRQIIEQHLAEKINVKKMTNVLELSTTQAIKSAVQSGLGVGYVSKLTVQMELKMDILKEVKVQGIHIQRPLWMATSFERFPKESTKLFREFSLDYVRTKAFISL